MLGAGFALRDSGDDGLRIEPTMLAFGMATSSSTVNLVRTKDSFQ